MKRSHALRDLLDVDTNQASQLSYLKKPASPPVTPSKKRVKTYAHIDLESIKENIDFGLLTPESERVETVVPSVKKTNSTIDKPESEIIERDNEAAAINRFLDRVLDRQVGGTMYISGVPGTGKTVLVKELVSKRQTKGVKTAFVNCMAIGQPAQLYKQILAEFRYPTSDADKNIHRVIKSDTPHVVVLDELDRLVSNAQSAAAVLNLFSLSADSKLVVIGIANALDLMAKLVTKLPKLPLTLTFAPYTALQMETILSKLFGTHVHASALALCSKRVAASTGDLRKALSICRQAVAQRPQGSTAIVNVPQMAALCSQMFGTSVSKHIKDLNLQQQCVLSVMVKTKPATLTKLFENYCMAVRDEMGLPRLDMSLFLDIVNALEHNGFLHQTKGRARAGVRETNLSCSVHMIELLTGVTVDLVSRYLRST